MKFREFLRLGVTKSECRKGGVLRWCRPALRASRSCTSHRECLSGTSSFGTVAHLGRPKCSADDPEKVISHDQGGPWRDQLVSGMGNHTVVAQN